MGGDRLFDRWRRRYQGLLKRQSLLVRRCRRCGDAESLHELRVTLRRLRLMVRLAAPFVGHDAAERYCGWSRATSTITSEIRDLDVVLEWITSRSEATVVSRRVVSQRRRLFARRRTALHPMPEGLGRHLRRFRTHNKARKRFARRYANRFARLLQRIQPQARHYARMSIEERHAFRRQLRQLRYLRELALARRRHGHDRVLQLLLRPQVAMGEFQNLQLAEAVLNQLPRKILSPALLRDLAVAQARQSREIRAGLRALARQSSHLP